MILEIKGEGGAGEGEGAGLSPGPGPGAGEGDGGGGGGVGVGTEEGDEGVGVGAGEGGVGAGSGSGSAGGTNDMFVDYKVRIKNDLSSGIFLQCESGDDDLGAARITPTNEYRFSARINFFRTTLFYCYIKSTKHDINFRFDAFKATRDELQCISFRCFWSIRKNGVYFSNDNINWFRRYPWKL
ncbi:Plant self-incompatibility protein S1 family [Euphorbia peplus]|nr:Plant self-incompatibility protein S1 family [Euphorbia peplus]